MSKRVIVTSIASACAAVSAWTELGREFANGDKIYGEVGLVNTAGRLALRVTGATLAFVLTDCSFDWLFNAKDKIVEGRSSSGDETEEVEEDTVTEDE